MKAVILVGGEGTRLRPLTETIPKPLLPIVNRPFLHRVLDHLAEHGVHEVVASSSYLEESFAAFIAERRGDPHIIWITEAEPLGTGGAIVNALSHVGEESFFVLNGDILTDLDLTAMLAFHRAQGAVATIALHRVEDARPFGLVAAEAGGRVLEFREKPTEMIPGDINAGTYVLNAEALRGWDRGMISIEREIFPALIANGAPVYSLLSGAYWLDLGTPERYLQAHFDVLDGHVAGLRYAAPFVARSATVDPRAILGRRVVVGDRASLAEGARLEDSVLLSDVEVWPGARVNRSILGPGVSIGAGAVVEGSVLAAGARVESGVRLDGAKVSAGRTGGAAP